MSKAAKTAVYAKIAGFFLNEMENDLNRYLMFSMPIHEKIDNMKKRRDKGKITAHRFKKYKYKQKKILEIHPWHTNENPKSFLTRKIRQAQEAGFDRKDIRGFLKTLFKKNRLPILNDYRFQLACEKLARRHAEQKRQSEWIEEALVKIR